MSGSCNLPPWPGGVKISTGDQQAAFAERTCRDLAAWCWQLAVVGGGAPVNQVSLACMAAQAVVREFGPATLLWPLADTATFFGCRIMPEMVRRRKCSHCDGGGQVFPGDEPPPIRCGRCRGTGWDPLRA